MKLTLVLLISGMLHVSASTYAQNINLSVKEVSLKKVFKELRQQSGYNFLYNSKMLNETVPVSLSVKNMPINEVLDKCFNNQPVTYLIVDNTVIVKRKTTVSASAARQITISGTVNDIKGDPIPGVNVKLKGTQQGTATDLQGNYKLNAPNGDGTLVFSFIGFETKEVTINNNMHINVTLKQQSAALSEIVVTALGVRRSEKSLTYSTQQVDGDELTRVKSDNLMNALNGKVAGLSISPSASGVGGSVKVILRGNRSANGNNQPLYVIDGVPITNGSNANMQPTGTFGGSPDGGDGISNLNPEDIANISVLKGAAAAALYGSQAQNGVILITTKKGRAGKAQISYSSTFAVDHVAYEPQFQNSYGQTKSGAIDSWGAGISGSQDNLKNFFQNGTNWTNAVNLSAGSEVAQTYFSYANTHAKGVEPGNVLDRNNFNLRETAKFFDNKLTVDANINYINQKINNSPSFGLYLNPLTGLYLFPRGLDINTYKNSYLFDNQTGFARQNWFTNDNLQQNPWWIINRDPNFGTRNRVLLNGSVRYDVASWLSIQVRGNVDRTNDNYEQDRYSGTNSLFNSNGNGFLNLSDQTVEQKYGDLIANFTVPMHSPFKINGLVGGSITDNITRGLSLNGNLSTPDFFTPGNVIASLGGTTSNTTSNTVGIAPNHSQLQALFGNANFSYQDWLYLTVTGRNDWSSNLAFTPNVSYFYPSVGLSAILNQALNLPKVINYAKVRGTYAEVGNTIPPYLTSVQNTQNAAGQLVFNTAAAFRTLKPERTKSIELGTDLRFLDNRLNFSFTYYKTNTRDQYFPVQPITASLFSTGYVNAGNVQNSGIEFILGYEVVRGKDFTWNTAINGAKNTNKIIDVDSKDGINSFVLTGNGNNNYESHLAVGGSYGDIYGYSLTRDSQGRIVLNGSGTAANPYTPQANKTFSLLGNPNPKFQLGWSNSFDYKNFSLSFLIDGKFGGQVLSMTQAILDQNGVSKVTGDARNAGGVKVNGVDKSGNVVSTVNAQAWYQTIGGRDGITDQYIYSATVIRLREAAIGYTMPISNSAFKSVKVSVTGRNLVYFHKKAPFDPELTMSTGNGLSGVDVFNQPATRNVGLNLNVSF
ncbi:SusC/RagA family TonB-linked outer membrane protein [Mucilaginibacter sp. OK098]|uniref:SusC/RagA family TonB-linked outer membrane protein n=1 Tax=Mucilaginibacter sp. OK098 TaxID=1855297 RepID=UPI00093262A9|nr:SusC/RagA family TonB-linked outer membrane protein [Mucilaginibacter sp. OK098]